MKPGGLGLENTTRKELRSYTPVEKMASDKKELP